MSADIQLRGTRHEHCHRPHPIKQGGKWGMYVGFDCMCTGEQDILWQRLHSRLSHWGPPSSRTLPAGLLLGAHANCQHGVFI